MATQNNDNARAMEHMRTDREKGYAPKSRTIERTTPASAPRFTTSGVRPAPADAPRFQTGAVPVQIEQPTNGKQGPSKKMKLIVAILLLLVAVLVALLLFNSCSVEEPVHQSASGVELIDTAGMSDEEAQAMIDQKAREGMMDVSFATTMRINGNNIYIGFTNKDTNKNNQILTVIQDGKTIFNTHPLEPGYQIEDVQLPDSIVAKLHEGDAYATVSYANENEEPVGNATMFPVQIVIES